MHEEEEGGMKIFEEIRDYGQELLSVVDKRHEEVSVILESYFRQQITLKREQLDHQEQDNIEN